MIITVLEVGKAASKSKGKSKWYEVSVKYDSDKGEKEKKFLSFDADQYKLSKELEEGKSYEVSIEKDGDYWKWTAVKEIEAKVSKNESSPDVPAKSSSSNNPWVERNALDAAKFEFEKYKQILIVRQSQITNAIEFAINSSKDVTKEDVAEIADFFVNYVYNGIQKDAEEPNDLPVDDEDMPQ